MTPDLETEFIAASEDNPKYQTPGNVALAQADSLTAQTQKDELDKQADAAWRASGIDAPYDHRAAYAENATEFKGQPLPNKHVNADVVDIAGFDMKTGTQRRSVVSDRSGEAAAGVRELRKSSQVPGKPAPPLGKSVV